MGLCSSRECCDGETANDCCASGGDSGDGHTLGSGTECVAHCEDGASGAEDCVEMYTNGLWNDSPCQGRHGDGHICGFPDDGECLPSTYIFYPQRLSQQKAEDYCISQGGHLASIHSDADQQAVIDLAENHRVTPPVVRYMFEGNLLSAIGLNHGESHFDPPGSETYAVGHDGVANSALVFDNNDYLTINSPFPHRDTEFTIAVWLAPNEIVFEGWHAFVGFQNGGVCPGRSPSMWVDGGGHGDNEPGVNKGLHYDSCDNTADPGQRYAGVLRDFFTTPGEYVHVVWVKQGTKYLFYKNGVKWDQDYDAPVEVQLSDQYNIGHNDNYFDGKIDEVNFFDFALSAEDVTTMFTGSGSLAAGDHPAEIWVK